MATSTGLWRVVAERTARPETNPVRRARGPWSNFKGMMFQNELAAGHGLFFCPTGVHTEFIRFPLDLVLVDQHEGVVKVREVIPSWRFDITTAEGVIELAVGAARAADLHPGERLRYEPASS